MLCSEKWDGGAPVKRELVNDDLVALLADVVLVEKTVRMANLLRAYLIFVIFFTHAKFLEKKIYTEIYTVNCKFFALNL